jgi:DNA-binding MarR family transcriptional regulator
MMADGAKARAEQQIDELLDTVLMRGQELTHLLLSRRLSAGLYRRIAGGIPPVQLQALTVLAAGDVRMHELARRLGLATSTVTRLVDRLEAAGLAERRSERPDRRSVLVGLSTSGSQALHAVRKRLRAFLGELLTGLPPHDQGEFLRLLAKLGEGLNLQALEPLPVRPRSQ